MVLRRSPRASLWGEQADKILDFPNEASTLVRHRDVIGRSPISSEPTRSSPDASDFAGSATSTYCDICNSVNADVVRRGAVDKWRGQTSRRAERDIQRWRASTRVVTSPRDRTAQAIVPYLESSP